MVCHLAESLKMALGDLPVARRTLPIRYPPLKQLIMYIAPFPKNVPTAPELLARAPRDGAPTSASCGRCVERFARAAAERRRGRSIRRSAGCRTRAWGVLVYRHMDHHLRQFGA